MIHNAASKKTDKQWPDRATVWGWAKCALCKKRTSVILGFSGRPLCDECWAGLAKREGWNP
jgi:hypothetical protein